MAIRVSATEANPTHHMSLTDGVDTLGLILCNGKGEASALGLRQSGYPRSVTRISQGVSGYSDFELPYSPTVQSDFSGGRGLEDFERDQTRFYDSYRADTTRGDFICGPKATVAPPNTRTQTTGSVAGTDNRFVVIYTQFTATFSGMNGLTVGSANPLAGTPGLVRIAIHTNSGTDTPEDVIGSAGLTLPPTGATNKFVPISAPIVAGTKYWVSFSSVWLNNPAAYFGMTNTPGTSLGGQGGMNQPGPLNDNLAFTIHEAGPAVHRYFDYRGSLFSASSFDTNGKTKLYLNGYHGMEADNGGHTNYMQTSLNLTANSLVGKIVKIVAGKGSEERRNWRVVESHSAGANAVLNFYEDPWQIPHDATTEFAVLGCNTWQEIAWGTNAPEVAVTDIMVLDDMVFFALGESNTIVRGKMTSGTWAFYYDGTNKTTGSKATFLKHIIDVQGKRQVWRALAQASTVSYAPKPTWAASNSAILTWKTDVVCGSTDSKITGIEEYSAGGPLIPYILKEDGFGSISGTSDTVVGVYAEHPLSAQLKNVRSEDNGRAHMRYDLFLKFSLLDGLESHFDQRLDDVGPNRDEGLPTDRRGPIYDMVPYAGRFYAAVDGGESGYSSVLCCTRDNSWHEIYRGASGQRIRSLHIQVIPGNTADRLWIGEGYTMYWLPLAIDPRKQADYGYFSGAQVITPWIYSGFKDVNKYFHELTVFAEGLDTTHQYIQAAYRVDNETSWTTIATNFTTSPAQAIRLSSSNNVSGKRIQLRFTLYTDNELITPRIKAYRLDGVIRLKPKKMWSVTYKVKDSDTDLTRAAQSGLTIAGQAVSWTPENVLALLDKWADSDQTPDPLTMRTLRALNDNKLVFIEPTSITPLSQVTDPSRTTVLVGSFTLLEA